MFNYGHPPGYNPHHPRSGSGAAVPAAGTPDISDSLKAQAIREGATHLGQVDGRIVFYHQRLGMWYSSGPEFESWWRCEGQPEGIVNIAGE